MVTFVPFEYSQKNLADYSGSVNLGGHIADPGLDLTWRYMLTH